MKLLLFILLISHYSGFLKGQDIKHYQKKWKTEKIILPYQSYDASIFNIVFEDSLYKNATITIKKAEIQKIKKASCLIIMENKEYTVSSVQVKGKKRFSQLKTMIGMLINQDISNIEPGDYCYNVRGDNIKLRYQDMGRKKVLTLIKSECVADN